MTSALIYRTPPPLPAPKRDGSSPEELREWVGTILQREQEAGIFGTITVSIEGGRITRIETKRSERPPSVG